jgi:hypothetical protein
MCLINSIIIYGKSIIIENGKSNIGNLVKSIIIKPVITANNPIIVAEVIIILHIILAIAKYASILDS